VFQELQGHVHHGRGADLLDLELGPPGELQEVADDGVQVLDLVGDDLEVLLLLGLEPEAPLQGEEPHLHRGQRIADAVGHARGQLAHQGQLLGLAQGLAAFGQKRLGLVHVLQQGAHPVAQRAYLVEQGARAGARGQAADGLQDLREEHPAQPEAQEGSEQDGGQGHSGEGPGALAVVRADLGDVVLVQALVFLGQVVDLLELLANLPLPGLALLGPALPV
jgi:hypothetical protein